MSFEELHEWWQNLTPDVQAILRAAGTLLSAWLVGRILAALVGRKLQACHFDDLLSPPRPSPSTSQLPETQKFSPSGIARFLVKATVWAGAIWVLAVEHALPSLAQTVEWAVGRAWLLAVVVAVALFLGQVLARAAMALLQTSPLREKLARWSPRVSDREQRGSLVLLTGTLVYSMAALLVLLIASDMFSWSMTGSAIVAVWHLALRLFTAGIALMIGWFGCQWATDMIPADVEPGSAPAQASHYTALGILSISTLLAITLLASSVSVVSGLALLAILSIFLWPVREYVADVSAGIVLKMQKVQQVRINGELAHVTAVGFIQTELIRNEAPLTRRNRTVLDAYLKGTAA